MTQSWRNCCARGIHCVLGKIRVGNEKHRGKNTEKHLTSKLLCFEWSPPWHFKTACWHHFCLKLLSRDFCPTNYPNHLFHLAGHCACQSVKQDINMSVGTYLSDILSNFLLHILCPISSYMRSGREHLAWILAVEVRQGTLGVDGRGWGPAGNTGRGWSWLRSGREHWAWMVVVEVRQRTLCVEGRGWAGGGGEERRRGAGNWHKI